MDSGSNGSGGKETKCTGRVLRYLTKDGAIVGIEVQQSGPEGLLFSVRLDHLDECHQGKHPHELKCFSAGGLALGVIVEFTKNEAGKLISVMPLLFRDVTQPSNQPARMIPVSY